MSKKIIFLLMLIVSLGAGARATEAQVPHLMRYQGVLLDHSGQPLEGVHTLNFRIYDALTGGNLLWNETQSGVPVTQGYFSVLLGNVASLNLPFDKDYYLTTEVGTDGEMSPRQKITSSPYAMRAEVADRAEVAETLVNNTWGPISLVDSKVGIGTSTPSQMLHIYKAGDTAGLIIEQGTADTNLDAGLYFKEAGVYKWAIYEDADDADKLRIGSGNGSEVVMTVTQDGNVGIGTTIPGNILTVMQGSPTDPIADSWTVHPSDRAHKQVLGPAAGGYLDQVRSTQLYEWKRAPLVSDEEAKEALGPADPTAEALNAKKEELVRLKTSLPKFATKRVGMVIDDENVPPEILTFHPDGTKAGIDLLAYIGYLHAALKEATLKMDTLESRLNAIEKQ